MDKDRAEAMLAEARAELHTAESVVLHLRQVVGGLEGLLKAAPMSQPIMHRQDAPEQEGRALVVSADQHGVSDEAAREYPKPGAVIFSILREKPHLPFKFSTIWTIIKDRDLVDPNLSAGRNAYSTAARRLASSRSDVRRDEQGRFVYVPAVPLANDSLSSADDEGAHEGHLREVFTS